MEHQNLLEALRLWGARPAEGVERCVGDEALYLTCVQAFAKDQSFDTLYAAQDQQLLFEAVHMLKGVAGNLSLTPLYELLGIMTAELRAEATAQIPAQTAQVAQLQTQLQALLAENPME